MWNFLDKTNNDYTNVAHISDEGNLTLLVDNLPDTAKKSLEEKATEICIEAESHIEMPDPNTTIDEMYDYGYTAEELLPLSKERALELYNEDLAIYILYPDNTEAMVFNLEEFEEHDGYFGIEVVDWEKYLSKHEKQHTDFSLSTEEKKAFVQHSEESYAIYQLKSGAEFRDYRFTGASELERMRKEIDRENYNLIYTGELQNVESVSHALDCLYHDFNQDKPDDFKGHSLSVSDIVAINMNDKVSYHYVDTIGFKELENYLKTAEMSMEQNLNSIDGIINNGSIVGKIDYFDNNGKVVETMEYTDKAEFDKQVKEDRYYGVPMEATLLNQPTVAELEHDAKNGKPVSLMDILDATRREQKQNQPQTKKEKQAHSKGVEMER